MRQRDNRETEGDRATFMERKIQRERQQTDRDTETDNRQTQTIDRGTENRKKDKTDT